MASASTSFDVDRDPAEDALEDNPISDFAALSAAWNERALPSPSLCC